MQDGSEVVEKLLFKHSLRNTVSSSILSAYVYYTCESKKAKVGYISQIVKEPGLGLDVL